MKVLSRIKSGDTGQKSKTEMRAIAQSMIDAGAETAKVQAALVAGTAFPDFSEKDLAGHSLSIARFKGKIVLVDFWATWCGPCVAELPKVKDAYSKYHAKGFDTIAVAMSYDFPSYVVNFAETRKLPFGVAIDNTGSVAKAWGDVQLTPTTYLVNQQGEIVKRYVGEPNFADLHRLIESLLAKS